MRDLGCQYRAYERRTATGDVLQLVAIVALAVGSFARTIATSRWSLSVTLRHMAGRQISMRPD
jgi:hypothetical protein